MKLTLSLRIVEPCVQCGYLFSYGDLIRNFSPTITCSRCGVENPVYNRPVDFSGGRHATSSKTFTCDICGVEVLLWLLNGEIIYNVHAPF